MWSFYLYIQENFSEKFAFILLDFIHTSFTRPSSNEYLRLLENRDITVFRNATNGTAPIADLSFPHPMLPPLPMLYFAHIVTWSWMRFHFNSPITVSFSLFLQLTDTQGWLYLNFLKVVFFLFYCCLSESALISFCSIGSYDHRFPVNNLMEFVN